MYWYMSNLILATFLLAFTNKINSNSYIETSLNTNFNISICNSLINDSPYVATGFYSLVDKGQGITMHKDHSNETYSISKHPFASAKNILRAVAQKNTIQGQVTFGVTIVFDNQGTKELEQGTGNPLYPYVAVVIANRLIYVVENASKIRTGVMQVVLVGYTEREVNEMIAAVNQNK